MTRKNMIGELSRIADLTSSGDDRTNANHYLELLDNEVATDENEIVEFINRAQQHLITEEYKVKPVY